MTTLNASPKAYALIKEFEDFRSTLYNCPANHCTIGYGHLVHRGPIDGRAEETPFLNGITEEHAEELLRCDVRAKAEHYLRASVKQALNQNQYDALCCFVFNVGGGNFQSSTLLKKLNAGDFPGAAQEFLRWDKANGKPLAGLTRRRTREAALFQESV